MRGFDAEFRDLDHYIRVITERIWEGGRIDDIRTYYSDPCIVETPLSVTTALEDVVSGTRAMLAMFPDRRLLAEDVIQSGDDRGGFLSSHRGISTMTHLGDGSFGRATGARVHVRTVADCVCRDNRIIHEWLVRDQAAIALQIGSTPQALAQQWLAQRGGWTKPAAAAAPPGYVSHVSEDPQAQAYAQAIARFTARDYGLADVYDAAAMQIGPGERLQYGHAEIADFWRSLFSSLRVSRFELEHLVMQRDMARTGRPDRVALRFRAQSLHEPFDMDARRFGNGTGQPVELLGIVHAEFVQGRVVREWVLLDEVAIWMQILARRA
jgi:predicted ester cyclase